MDYEQMIKYIILGLDDKKLNKIIKYKKINIGNNTIRDVNKKTRNIIVKQLFSKNNLFIIYRLIVDKKVNVPEDLIQKLTQKGDVIDLEIWIKMMESGQIPQLSGTSYFLIYIIQTRELSKAVDTYIEYEKILNEIRELKTIHNHEKIEQDSLEEQYKALLLEYNSLDNKFNKLEKKRQHEVKKFENNEKKLNSDITKKNEEVYKQIVLKKEIEKKYQELFDKMSEEKKEVNNNNTIINSLNLKLEYLKKEMIIKNEEVKKLKNDQFKKYNTIEEYKNIENSYIQKIKSLEKEVENFSKETCSDENNLGTKTEESDATHFEPEELDSVVEPDENNVKLHTNEAVESKILLLGDVSKYAFAKNNIKSIFDIYNKDDILKKIELINESDYIEIWLLSHQITKKSLKNYILKKFKNVIIINNITELERMYNDAK